MRRKAFFCFRGIIFRYSEVAKIVIIGIIPDAHAHSRRTIYNDLERGRAGNGIPANASAAATLMIEAQCCPMRRVARQEFQTTFCDGCAVCMELVARNSAMLANYTHRHPRYGKRPLLLLMDLAWPIKIDQTAPVQSRTTLGKYQIEIKKNYPAPWKRSGHK